MIPIFDFDGTIIDSLEAHAQFYVDFAREKGIELNAERTRETLQDPKKVDGFFQRIGFPVKIVPELLQEYREKFQDYPQKAFPGMIELLKRIRMQEPRVSMATYNNRNNVHAHGREFLHLFDTVITQDDVERKNHGLTKIVMKYGLRPEEYVLIGDTSWDYDSARETGIQFIGVSWGWHRLQPQQEYPVVRTVQELETELTKLL